MALLVSISLGGSAYAQSSPAPAPAQTLAGLEAWNALVGNTISGHSGNGSSFSEYFDPSGKVRYVDQDGLSSGTWAVQDGKVCLDFPDDDDRTCPAFEVSGTSGTASEDQVSKIPFDILPGNPTGL